MSKPYYIKRLEPDLDPFIKKGMFRKFSKVRFTIEVPMSRVEKQRITYILESAMEKRKERIKEKSKNMFLAKGLIDSRRIVVIRRRARILILLHRYGIVKLKPIGNFWRLAHKMKRPKKAKTVRGEVNQLLSESVVEIDINKVLRLLRDGMWRIDIVLMFEETSEKEVTIRLTSIPILKGLPLKGLNMRVKKTIRERYYPEIAKKLETYHGLKSKLEL